LPAKQQEPWNLKESCFAFNTAAARGARPHAAGRARPPLHHRRFPASSFLMMYFFSRAGDDPSQSR
jgi:hypothetical protein